MSVRSSGLRGSAWPSSGAEHLALTVLEKKDRETLELAYWEAREREGSMDSEQQLVRSDISVIEQQSEARVLIRNRGLIALEILGDHELSRNCTDDSTPNPDAKSAVSLGSYYQLKEFLNSLVESQVNPETGLEREADLRQFGKEIAVRLNCMVQRFNAQSRFQGGSSETTPGARRYDSSAWPTTISSAASDLCPFSMPIPGC